MQTLCHKSLILQGLGSKGEKVKTLKTKVDFKVFIIRNYEFLHYFVKKRKEGLEEPLDL